MTIHRTLSALALVAALALPRASRAESNADSALCFFDAKSVYTAKPDHGPATGMNSLERLRGVEVQLVPAVSLSTEQLIARLKRLLRGTTRELRPVCLLDVGHVHIGSNSMGDAASATLVARDPSDALQVLRRAQGLWADPSDARDAAERAAYRWGRSSGARAKGSADRQRSALSR